MQHYVTLLRLRLQVGQALPCLQVFGAGDTSCCSGCTQVAGLAVVVTLSAEDTINPAILMLCDAHIINIGSRDDVVRHGDRLLPEAEVIHAVRRLGHGKERLAVSTLDTNYQTILALPFDGSRIQRGIHHDTLHQVRVVLFAEIIAPFQRRMFSSKYRILPLVINTIPPLHGFILARQQLFMMSA